MNLRSPARLGAAAVISFSLLQIAVVSPTQASPTPRDVACDAVLPEAAPVTEVLADATSAEAQAVEATVEDSLGTAATTTAKTEAHTVDEALADEALWLDKCGEVFYMEEAGGHADEAPGSDITPNPTALLAPASETFNLSSRPGSDKTIFLDFRGQNVTGTEWNNNYGNPIVSAPLSLDSDPAFSTQELAIIQDTWRLMVDDFGAWDVNVTTKTPTADQLERATTSDPIYGYRALFANKTTIADQCGCGGLAYVGVSRAGTFARYSPAWVFTNKLGTSSKSMAEAASHEIGHNLGLAHDGTSTKGYYSGSAPWAPIMGVGYSQPVSQWSKGEYADANNKQDDLAIIGSKLQVLPDSQPNVYTDAAVPSVALAGSSTLSGTVNGVITSGSDRDVVKVTAAGNSSFVVKPHGVQPNLDLGVRLLNANGNEVASSNPTVSYSSSRVALGLDAVVKVTLPATPADYYLEVFPVGHKTPTEAGGYSTYGSIGGWTGQITTEPATVADPSTDPPVDTPQPLSPVSFTMPTSYSMEVGKAFTAQLTATGGNGVYKWSASGLPAGVSLSSSGRLAGTPTKAVTTSLAVTATSAAGTPQVVSTTRAASVKVYSRVAWKTSSTLPAVKKGKSFTKNVYITGGKPNYKYSFSGRWPSGTKLYSYANSSRTNFYLKGKPSRKGTYKFTAKVTDNLGMTATRTYSIRVK